MIGLPVNPRLTFESFVVGPANRLAYAASRAAAEGPGSAYNPLLLHGGPGLGKTHLLVAVANLCREVQPDARVIYTSVGRLIRDLERGAEAEAAHLEADIFLLDELQYLSTWRERQPVVSNLLDSHLTMGHQVVVACDRPPVELDAIDERLVSRLTGGLVVAITRPSFETRKAILQRKLKEQGVALDPAVVEEIARLAMDNVRQLQGALHKVLAVERVESRRVTGREVSELLGDLTGGAEVASAAAPEEAASDEFSAFLSGIAEAVEEMVRMPRWRAELTAAAQRYAALGLRTARLEGLLQSETPVDAAAAIAKFEADVAALRVAAAEMARLDPRRATHPAFSDPDLLPEAQAMVREARGPAKGKPAAGAPVRKDVREAPPAPAAPPAVGQPSLDAEKLVLDWPNLDERLIEEFA